VTENLRRDLIEAAAKATSTNSWLNFPRAEAVLDAILDLLDSRAEEWRNKGARLEDWVRIPEAQLRRLIAALRQPQEGV
jgi:hypothetical protein